MSTASQSNRVEGGDIIYRCVTLLCQVTEYFLAD